MRTMNEIDWEMEQDRFMAVAYPFALRAAKRAFKRWHKRKRADAEAEFMAKVWHQWKRLLDKGRDPEPLRWPLIHWARQWVRYDRRLSGRSRNIDIQDYRAGIVQHLMDGRGQLHPHDRSDRINGFLDWAGQAKTDDPAALVAALEQAGLTLDEYLAA
jgi:hypothetical protein